MFAYHWPYKTTSRPYYRVHYVQFSFSRRMKDLKSFKGEKFLTVSLKKCYYPISYIFIFIISRLTRLIKTILDIWISESAVQHLQFNTFSVIKACTFKFSSSSQQVLRSQTRILNPSFLRWQWFLVNYFGILSLVILLTWFFLWNWLLSINCMCVVLEIPPLCQHFV